jgi:hypothetical protein
MMRRDAAMIKRLAVADVICRDQCRVADAALVGNRGENAQL